MRKIGKIIGCCLIAVSLLACTACSGLDRLPFSFKQERTTSELSVQTFQAQSRLPWSKRQNDMKRILIVDDNTEYLQILSSVLSGEFETIKATGVEDALDTLQTITVDAICSDFNMKDGTGLDLLEKIRQQGLKTPFLLMSGDNSRALEQKAKLYYGDFCCKTDFDLVEKIKALVNN